MSDDMPGMRASHDDRDRVVDALRVAGVAGGDGRLSAGELDTRLERALSARTLGGLAGLTADLPKRTCSQRKTRDQAACRQVRAAGALAGACAYRASHVDLPGHPRLHPRGDHLERPCGSMRTWCTASCSSSARRAS